MKTVYYKVSAFTLLCIGLASCKYEAKTNKNNYSKEIDRPDSTKDSLVIKADTHQISLTIDKINAEQFHTVSQQEKISKPAQKITDFQVAKKQLASVVDFKEMDGYLRIEKINFRNGTSTDNKDPLDECTFVAYFPADDVLLLEGGHSYEYYKVRII